MPVRQATGLQNYYTYDPNVGDEPGGNRIREDDNGKYILANPSTAQYWVDQGMLGVEPLSKLSGPAKEFLAQVTRGRSEDNDKKPKRVPKYNKAAQSGAPVFAGTPARVKAKQRRKDRQQDRKKDNKPPKKPEPKSSETKPPPANF